MKRRLPVEWAASAERDLAAVVEYIAREDSGAAMGVLDRLERNASSLATFATRGRVVPELQRVQVREYRELLVKPYRLVYRVENLRVVVLGVFDGRRDLEDILLDRLLRES